MNTASFAYETQAARAPGLERLLRVFFALTVASGFIGVIEPAPYDLLILLTISIWMLSNPRFHVSLVLIFSLFIINLLAGFISLTPHWNKPTSVEFQLVSVYLVLTFIFFSVFLSEQTEERMSLCLKAYAYGALVSSIYGIAGYLNIGGLGAYTIMHGFRVSGAFKDPNVFGPYLTLAAVYFLHVLLRGGSRRPLLQAIYLCIVLLAILLSFSRGALGGSILACGLTYFTFFVTSASAAQRARMIKLLAIGLFAVVTAVSLMMADDETRQIITSRLQLKQEYDTGETGRFGNQIRSIPMLIQLPNGFGPLIFDDYFGLAPHSSYVNAFASQGWLGGFTWIMIVIATCYVGFRLSFARSPFRTHAQVVWPALFVMLLQGFQIDIDHWRHVFLIFGALWGLEAARVRWMMQESARRQASRLPGRYGRSPEPA